MKIEIYVHTVLRCKKVLSKNKIKTLKLRKEELKTGEMIYPSRTR